MTIWVNIKTCWVEEALQKEYSVVPLTWSSRTGKTNLQRRKIKTVLHEEMGIDGKQAWKNALYLQGFVATQVHLFLKT